MGPVGAALTRKVNPKLLIGLGASLMLAGTFFASYMINWYLFVLFYAVLYPVGMGLVYYVPMICCWEWFPENKGLVSGLIVGGFGFGAFIFGFLSTALANPDHDNPDKVTKFFPKEVGERTPGMLRICVICWAVLSFISLILVSRNPEAIKKQKAEERMELVKNTDDPDFVPDFAPRETSITFMQGLKSARFFH